jgi:hypothetical protein
MEFVYNYVIKILKQIFKLPGLTGMPGKAGDDGLDIQLEAEIEIPCIVCPSGPPGQRLLLILLFVFIIWLF